MKKLIKLTTQPFISPTTDTLFLVNRLIRVVNNGNVCNTNSSSILRHVKLTALLTNHFDQNERTNFSTQKKIANKPKTSHFKKIKRSTNRSIQKEFRYVNTRKREYGHPPFYQSFIYPELFSKVPFGPAANSKTAHSQVLSHFCSRRLASLARHQSLLSLYH